MDVVIRDDLNHPETHFIKKRQLKVQGTLHSHGIACTEDSIPRVALLGSGGGQRAHTGFLGVIQQLGKENLLDCMLYVAGVSGSVWSMSSLYQDPTWSQHPEEATDKVLLSMSEGKGPTLSEGVQWLKQREKEGDMSLTDVWGVLTCLIKGESLETRPLHGDKDEDGSGPYPLYSAIEKRCFHDKLNELWFEFSPHESGLLQPGAYLDTSLLRKNFEGGKLCPKQPVQRQPMDMVQVQGICGSAMGDFHQIIQFMKDLLWDWIHSFSLVIENRSTQGMMDDVIIILADLRKMYADTEYSVCELGRLKTLLGENYGEYSPSLKGIDHEIWKNMTDQDRKKLVANICDELVVSTDKWTQVFPQTRLFGLISDGCWIFIYVMPLFAKWNFGTMANVLYKFQDPCIPQHMTREEDMHLIDAGLYLNSPYPSALRPARDIDLIISFDFSDGDPFETLRVASEYAEKNQHPFPKVNFTHLDPDRPKSYYVFDGKGKPTVIHIPLFNMDNCENEAKIKEERKEYTTFKLPYKDRVTIDHLADLAAENVRMNKKKILQEIKKAAHRCKH